MADVVAAVRALARQDWVGPIYLLGHSEGADVAAGAGKTLGSAIAGVGLLSGAGATRFFDSVAVAHRHSDLAGVKSALDDLIALTGDHPPAEYSGASNVRQVTYAIDSTPLDDLRMTTLPLFVAGGTEDEKAPIESADLFVAEILRNKTRGVKYLILPGMDHGYNTADGTSHMVQVIGAFLDWTATAKKERSVLLGLGGGAHP